MAALAAAVMGLPALDLVVAADSYSVLAALAAVMKGLALYRADIEAVGGARGYTEHLLHDDLPLPAVRADLAKQFERHQMGNFVGNDFV